MITDSFLHLGIINPTPYSDFTFLLSSKYSPHFDHTETNDCYIFLMKLNEFLLVSGPRALLGCYGFTNKLLRTSPTDALDFIDLGPHGGCSYSGGRLLSIPVMSSRAVN